MSDIAKLRVQYGGMVLSLSVALEAGDEVAFAATLDQIVHLREKNLFVELRRLTVGLQGALERFTLDSRLVDLAEKEMPDARHRLEHVLKLTDEAAHKTMDLVEQSVPIADRTAKSAADLLVFWKRFRAREIAIEDFKTMLSHMDEFLVATQGDTEMLRNNLSEVLMTQGYQDITGQIIRGVMKLVAELETTLGELVHLAADGAPETTEVTGSRSHGYGPAVPGIDHGPAVSDQQDVDSLLSGLGL
jgi:chemotaxis protein CheZ